MRKERMEEIIKDVEREFPNDYALQQIHIARKLLAEEAKEEGITLWKYIEKQAKKAKDAMHGV